MQRFETQLNQLGPRDSAVSTNLLIPKSDGQVGDALMQEPGRFSHSCLNLHAPNGSGWLTSCEYTAAHSCELQHVAVALVLTCILPSPSQRSSARQHTPELIHSSCLQENGGVQLHAPSEGT